MRRRVESKVNKRTLFLMQTEALFGKALILGGNEQAQRPVVEVVHSVCVGKYWALPANGGKNTLWHKAMPKREPPAEIHALVTVDSLLQQYIRLRSWMECTAKQHGWHEYFELDSLVVRRKTHSAGGEPMAAFEISVKGLREAR